MSLYLFPLSSFFFGDIFQFLNIEIQTQNTHIWHLENSALKEVLARKMESVCFFHNEALKKHRGNSGSHYQNISAYCLCFQKANIKRKYVLIQCSNNFNKTFQNFHYPNILIPFKNSISRFTALCSTIIHRLHNMIYRGTIEIKSEEYPWIFPVPERTLQSETCQLSP